MLRKATEAEKRDRDLLTHVAWGGGLSVDDWVVREARLRAHAWALRDMTTWLLVGEAGNVLSSCETFRMRSTLDGREGHCHGVASVFTEERLRGRGHAAEMMGELIDALEEDDALSQSSILFSDVGASLYERAGYRAVPAFDRLFEPAATPPRAEAIGEGALAAAAGRLRAPTGRYAVHPSAAQLDWHLERERIYSQALGRRRPTACGAVVGESTALWGCVFKSDELHVLAFDARTSLDADRLVAAARFAAHEAGLARVRLWEAPLPFAWSGGERVARDGSLPMLCPLVRGLSSRDWTDVWRGLWV